MRFTKFDLVGTFIRKLHFVKQSEKLFQGIYIFTTISSGRIKGL